MPSGQPANGEATVVPVPLAAGAAVPPVTPEPLTNSEGSAIAALIAPTRVIVVSIDITPGNRQGRTAFEGMADRLKRSGATVVAPPLTTVPSMNRRYVASAGLLRPSEALFYPPASRPARGRIIARRASLQR